MFLYLPFYLIIVHFWMLTFWRKKYHVYPLIFKACMKLHSDDQYILSHHMMIQLTYYFIICKLIKHLSNGFQSDWKGLVSKTLDFCPQPEWIRVQFCNTFKCLPRKNIQKLRAITYLMTFTKRVRHGSAMSPKISKHF